MVNIGPLAIVPGAILSPDMMRFSYSISNVPGKDLYKADKLSHALLVRPREQREEKLEHDVKAFVDSVVR